MTVDQKPQKQRERRKEVGNTYQVSVKNSLSLRQRVIVDVHNLLLHAKLVPSNMRPVLHVIKRH